MPLVRYAHNIAEYDCAIPIVEEGSVYSVANDISHIDGGSSCGVFATTDFIASLPEASGVFFDNSSGKSAETADFISVAEAQGKRVHYCGDHIDEVRVGNINICRLAYPELTEDVAPTHRLHEIPVPVVLVLGQGQRCNKFDIQMGLRNAFIYREYKVSQVGTKPYSELFGFHVLPQVSGAPLWKKIILYNRYFRELVKKEEPDVLVVGAPGGTMPIDERHNELFGETAMAVSKSLRPDVTILSTYYGKIDDEYIENAINYAKYALDAQVGYFHLSNTKLVVDQDTKLIHYLTTPSNKVFDIQEMLDDRFFSVFDPKTSANVYGKIISELQSNIEVL